MAEVANYSPRLRKHYDDVVRPAMIEKFGYKNPMEVPTIDKIVLNMGVGEATGDSKKPTVAAGDLALIAGQNAVVTRARKAIATFKIRENMPRWEAIDNPKQQQHQQEQMIGRHRDSGLPLGQKNLTPEFPDPTDASQSPLNAHIRKVQPRRPTPDQFGLR